MSELQTNKRDFGKTRLINTAPIELQEGDIKLAVNNFSFTANNITYAVAGERIRYWEFFPTHDDPNNEWGIIPVWGFATVTESRSEEIPVGERLFGYFPPADEVKLTPVNVSSATLFDGAAHRADLPAGYNVYRRVAGEANYDPAFDKERMLLFPLYVTSFCLHDMLQDNDWFGAEQVIVGSASSKTSIGLGYAIQEDDKAPTQIGLTSARNKASVEKLGIYDQVVSYDDLEAISANKKTVIVDMSGNGELLAKLHTHLGDNMVFTSNVGMTHWESFGTQPGFNHERSQMFFAPGHIQQRIKQWGAEGFDQKSGAFIVRTALKSHTWLTMQEVDGLSGLESVYPDVCHGQLAPEVGLIIQLS